MVLAGHERVGTHDWYREGAAQLLRTQYKDGSWRGEHPLYATSFALLFLTRAADPPRAFTRPSGEAPVDPDRPLTGPEDEAAEPSPNDAPAAAEPAVSGTLEDWLDEDRPPGELARRCRLRGVSTLRPLVRFLDDPDRAKRQRAFEALDALLPRARTFNVDRHPLARGRLELWLRRNAGALVLQGDLFVAGD